MNEQTKKQEVATKKASAVAAPTIDLGMVAQDQEHVLSSRIGIIPRLGSFPSTWSLQCLSVTSSLRIYALPPTLPLSLVSPR